MARSGSDGPVADRGETFRPRAKICGLTRKRDALRAEELGADLLGVVLTPGFSRSVPLERAPEVVAGTSAPKVAVLVDERPDRAAEAAAAIGASVLQLHGHEDRSAVLALRDRGPWSLWRAVRARRLDDVRAVVDALSDVVDGILVEGWREGVVGGGGVRVSLEAEAVREAIPPGVDFILAGGLEPDSLARTVARFRPDVVDVSSGVEGAVGVKDEHLVEAFLRAAHGQSAP